MQVLRSVCWYCYARNLHGCVIAMHIILWVNATFMWNVTIAPPATGVNRPLFDFTSVGLPLVGWVSIQAVNCDIQCIGFS